MNEMVYVSLLWLCNHKAKTYSRQTKNEKGIKACYYRKPPIPKGSQQERKEQGNYKTARKETDKMALLSLYLSIITLDVNALDFLIKRNRMAGWVKKKKRPDCMLVTRDSLQTFRFKDTCRLKVKSQKKILHAVETKEQEQFLVILDKNLNQKL